MITAEQLTDAEQAERAAYAAYLAARTSLADIRRQYNREQLDARGIKTGKDGTICFFERYGGKIKRGWLIVDDYGEGNILMLPITKTNRRYMGQNAIRVNLEDIRIE